MLKYLGVKNIDSKFDYVFHNENFKIYCKNETTKEIAKKTVDDLLNNPFYNKEDLSKGLFRLDSERIIYFYNVKEKDCEDVITLLNAYKRISIKNKIYLILYFQDGDSLHDIYENKYWQLFDFIKINPKINKYIYFCECTNSDEKGLRVFVTI